MENEERNTDGIKKRASQSYSFELELVKNTDQPVPRIILVRVDTYSFDFFIRGYRTYMDIWNPKIDNFFQFLALPNYFVRCKVTGKQVNRGGGYGREITVTYKFLGNGKTIKWIQKNVNKTINDLLMKTDQCMFKTVSYKIHEKSVKKKNKINKPAKISTLDFSPLSALEESI